MLQLYIIFSLDFFKSPEIKISKASNFDVTQYTPKNLKVQF
jgi:hypothetical protein